MEAAPEFEPTTAKRVARNDAIFRDANERVIAWATKHEVASEMFPVICECADPDCREIVFVSLLAYEAVRAVPTHFINAPGHDAEDGQHVKAVVEKPGYVVVEKVGRAGEVAEELADGSGALASRSPEE
jgi:hypothetical protein